jgi:hypothetical protein
MVLPVFYVEFRFVQIQQVNPVRNRLGAVMANSCILFLMDE